MTELDSIFKSRDITLLTKFHIVKAMVFPVVILWMWELYDKEGWALKNWYFWTAGLEKTLESPLESKEIKPVNSKGSQPWKFIGRTDSEAAAAILGYLLERVDSVEHSLMLGKVEGRRRRGWQKMKWLDGITDSTDVSFSKPWEIVKDGVRGVLQSMVPWRFRHDLGTEQQQWAQFKTADLIAFGAPKTKVYICFWLLL